MGPDGDAGPSWTRADIVRPTATWAAIALITTTVQGTTHRIARTGADLHAATIASGPGAAAEGRIAGDSGLYLRVADVGYRLEEGLEAGFPAYAMAMRHLAGATGMDLVTAGVLISLAAGWAVALLAHRWMTLVGLDGRERDLGVLLTLLFPAAYLLYGVVYADALLLAATLGALVLAERGRWLGAGLVGALATLTKPNGAIVAVTLVALAAERSAAMTVVLDRARPRWRRLRVEWRWHRLERRQAWAGLAFAGIGAYAAWLWHHAGNPLHFASLQTDQYGHSPIWHPYAWLKFPVWKPLHAPYEWVHEAASLVLVIAALATVPRIVRSFGASYAVLVAGAVLISWSGTYNFAPSHRYLLPAIPVLVAAWAPSLARRPARAGTAVAASAATMLLLAASFAGAFPLNW